MEKSKFIKLVSDKKNNIRSFTISVKLDSDIIHPYIKYKLQTDEPVDIERHHMRLILKSHFRDIQAPVIKSFINHMPFQGCMFIINGSTSPEVKLRYTSIDVADGFIVYSILTNLFKDNDSVQLVQGW